MPTLHLLGPPVSEPLSWAVALLLSHCGGISRSALSQAAGGHSARCRYNLSIPSGVPLSPPGHRAQWINAPSCPASSGAPLMCIPHSCSEGPAQRGPPLPECRLRNAPCLVSLPSLCYSPLCLIFIPRDRLSPELPALKTLSQENPRKTGPPSPTSCRAPQTRSRYHRHICIHI